MEPSCCLLSSNDRLLLASRSKKEVTFMQCIKYKAGYKYQLKSNYAVTISIKPPADIITAYITLNAQGMLTLKDGYAWDGPSGPPIDTMTFMRGSLIHDALYQLMREGKLDQNVHREAADSILREVCIEDGMWSFRAWYVYQAVRQFARTAADP